MQFPDRRLRFGNDPDILTNEVGALFPRNVDHYNRLLSDIKAYDDIRADCPYRSTREILAEYLSEPVLIEMLLCPVMYYGNPQEDDMDFTSFVTIFKSIFLEGLARPLGGVRTILRALVKRYRTCGGKLQMNCGVECIETSNDRVTGLTLSSGATVTADIILS